MSKTLAIICNCGHEVKGTDARKVEAEMWHHALDKHLDGLKSMSVEQLTDVMKGWDKTFASQR
jgi:hypothetical protein